jgi:hypothetical protein
VSHARSEQLALTSRYFQLALIVAICGIVAGVTLLSSDGDAGSSSQPVQVGDGPLGASVSRGSSISRTARNGKYAVFSTIGQNRIEGKASTP